MPFPPVNTEKKNNGKKKCAFWKTHVLGKFLGCQFKKIYNILDVACKLLTRLRINKVRFQGCK